jgi:hypothetical protein
MSQVIVPVWILMERGVVLRRIEPIEVLILTTCTILWVMLVYHRYLMGIERNRSGSPIERFGRNIK